MKYKDFSNRFLQKIKLYPQKHAYMIIFCSDLISYLKPLPSKYFNEMSVLDLDLYDVPTSQNVKSTLKQLPIRQC